MDLSADFEEVAEDSENSQNLQNVSVSSLVSDTPTVNENLNETNILGEETDNEPLNQNISENMETDETLEISETPENLETLETQPEPNFKPRRSKRDKVPTFGADSDYMVFAQEIEQALEVETDPKTFKTAIESEDSVKWQEAMDAEIESMKDNKV